MYSLLSEQIDTGSFSNLIVGISVTRVSPGATLITRLTNAVGCSRAKLPARGLRGPPTPPHASPHTPLLLSWGLQPSLPWGVAETTLSSVYTGKDVYPEQGLRAGTDPSGASRQHEGARHAGFGMERNMIITEKPVAEACFRAGPIQGLTPLAGSHPQGCHSCGSNHGALPSAGWNPGHLQACSGARGWDTTTGRTRRAGSESGERWFLRGKLGGLSKQCRAGNRFH